MADCIKVAVRIRPLVETERNLGSQSCVEGIKDAPMVSVKDGHSTCFSFNYVFDIDSSQEDIYEGAVHPLVHKLFEGFNVTILAYGQTGSGKTYTMGSNCLGDKEADGIIFRAVSDIFERVESNTDWSYKVTASFMELYMENLYDLLASTRNTVDIREDSKRICIPGLTEVEVLSKEDAMRCLRNGSIGRVTGATAMNQQSSRSHAIFTLTFQQQKINDPTTATTAKFHLVDLAGSERCKKTQAEGDRFKEGVTINAGLLALGNVISTLGEGGKRIPSYRTSKLTRLLQDSLGGNSLTLMIACISPADYNLSETLSTLRYADRARRIKNKPIINQDPKCAEIALLKRKVEELQLQLLEQGGPRNENPDEILKLEKELKLTEAKLRSVTNSYNEALLEMAVMQEKLMGLEAANDRFKECVADLQGEMDDKLQSFENAESIDEKLHYVTVLKKSFYEKIAIVQAEQEKTEQEQRSYKTENEVNFADNSMEDRQLLDEKQEEHVLKQVQLNRELKELQNALEMKTEMCQRYAKTSNCVVEQVKNSLLNKEEYERQIASLEEEKKELLASIKLLQATVDKEAEVKAKQLELNKKNMKIEELQKKLADHGKIVRQKETAEKKVESLAAEIRQIKQAKVKLIKQMRQESDQWRNWRIEREREFARLRDQNNKQKNEINKMNNLHIKQQNVNKRKLEEAAAVNKRLKEALSKQKSVRTQRELKGNKEQIQEFVTHTLEIVTSKVEAEHTLQELLEDRTELTQIIAKMRRETTNIQKLNEAEEELELRSTQIADFQRRILDAEQEIKAKSHWENIGTMIDAKAAITQCIKLAAEIKMKSLENMADHEASQKKAEEKINALQKKIEEAERIRARDNAEKQEEIMRLMEQNQDNLSVLVPARVEAEDKLLRKGQECKELQTKLDTILSVSLNPSVKRRISESRQLDALDLSMEVDIDDPSDPDWRKTPVFKKIQSMRKSIHPLAGRKRLLADDSFLRCGCHTSCDTKRCICKKKNVPCGENCSCDEAKCKFKLSVSEISEVSSLNETYFVESWNEKRRRTIFGVNNDVN